MFEFMQIHFKTKIILYVLTLHSHKASDLLTVCLRHISSKNSKASLVETL